MHEDLMRHLGDLGGAWRPRYSRLYGVPEPLKEELFSSWCWRVSTQTGIPIKALLLQFGQALPPSMLETGCVEHTIHKISETTQLPGEVIKNLFFPRMPSGAMADYVILTKLRNYLHRKHQRYCEICLKSDDIPFLRKSWRMDYRYLCERHNNVLRDKCPRCSSFLNFDLLVKPKVSSIRICRFCGGDLCDTSPVFLPHRLHDELLKYQAIKADKDAMLNTMALDLQESIRQCPDMISGEAGFIELATQFDPGNPLESMITNEHYLTIEFLTNHRERVIRNNVGGVVLRTPNGPFASMAVNLDGRLFSKKDIEEYEGKQIKMILRRNLCIWNDVGYRVCILSFSNL